MKSQLKNALLSAALVVMAMPVVAQNAPAPDPAPKSEVGKRQENQQDRIAQGVKSGQLTAGETAHLERNQARINRQVRADRQANGGKLTPQEKAQVNREQNRQSRKIYKDKHNNKVQ
jgi:predicted transglutaminase-like cysteine proteinase